MDADRVEEKVVERVKEGRLKQTTTSHSEQLPKALHKLF